MLPEELIAQRPAAQRDRSKLLYLHRQSGRRSHHQFYELYDLLSPSDTLVVNNTEVVPGRLFGNKDTGGKAEVLMLDYAGSCRAKTDGEFVCRCLVRSSKRPRIGTSIYFDQGLTAEVIDLQDDIFSLKFSFSGDFERILYRIGNVPLPPYIKRTQDDGDFNDRIFYQTVYASQKGAIAAPTAGLHFSTKLLEKLSEKGIGIVAITLHVSYGTFLPVRVADIREHRMHSERYHIAKESADVINRMKASGSRIVAVGTTCVRTLEYAADDKGRVACGSGNCDLFIHPGYRFKVIDVMITNFHLPRSTLLMLVSAFAGRDRVLEAYKEAIQKGYRFYSYGDAMLIA
ncbi:MAG: tRNA preQ1(34) S-adenosylmethionine ribosyltransferase-isomerase QueA, partial [Pseudomonadota bacterium]